MAPVGNTVEAVVGQGQTARMVLSTRPVRAGLVGRVMDLVPGLGMDQGMVQRMGQGMVLVQMFKAIVSNLQPIQGGLWGLCHRTQAKTSYNRRLATNP